MSSLTSWLPWRWSLKRCRFALLAPDMRSGAASLDIRWQRELPQWVLIWVMFAMAAFAWDDAPERLPVHWNLAGEVDRYTGKTEGLLALPIIALVTYMLLLVAPQLVQ